MRYFTASYLSLASSGVQAALLHNWATAGTPSWIPTETGTANIADGTTGWSPKPTKAPGFVSEQDQVVERLRRQALTDTTPWVNDHTCGWVAQTPSRAIVCGTDFTCATNSDDLVACVSGTFSPFFRVCMDLSAVQQGQCDDVGPGTGCCNDRASPACATWIWTGKPARSQYGCAARSTIYSVMDIPQFVLDSLTRSTSSSTKSSTIVSSKPTNTVEPSTVQTSAAPTGSITTGDNLTAGTQTSTTTNLAPIIGGAVGGLAGLILLLLLLCCCMRRRRNKKSSSVTKSNTKNNTTVNYYTSEENQFNTRSNTFHGAKESLDAAAAVREKPVGGDGGTGGGVSAIFCCAGRSGKKEKKVAKKSSSRNNSANTQPQHGVEEHHHHHHYHLDPHSNPSAAMSTVTTARNSDAGSGHGVAGIGMQGRSLSFEATQPYKAVGPPPPGHSPYSLAAMPQPVQMPAMPAMPDHFRHSPLGIMSNYPVPARPELDSGPPAVSVQPPMQVIYHHHQHPHQLQPGQYQPPVESIYGSIHGPIVHSSDGSIIAQAPAPAQVPSAAVAGPSYPQPPFTSSGAAAVAVPQPVTAMHTGVTAVASHLTGITSSSSSSSIASPHSRLVSPSPLSSTVSTVPSVHQQHYHQQTLGGGVGGDAVYHPLQAPPPSQQSARTSVAGLPFVGGAQSVQDSRPLPQQLGQVQQQQQQHCSCCEANSHHTTGN
ncbi:uncharacterized protein B0I36DRAFT_110615 [Microdochium trichocladiopsis]|uniref:Uncharacterized protein n=1 Tax=Microdochium trichocladiopsis TaxID=1682393 RepID=A0A9P9BVQ8_9PEZI|nr:uncharacterized protein B0I36DRAFT_110615 [Microdochium trichocladiopsis]KAH7033582.1 hypothetical protein B0I36DRAFT_110615 [Microdochium trichocladiopsis]